MSNNYFSKELLDMCQMTEEEFSAPVETLKKGHTYIIGHFNEGNVVTMISYKDGLYYIANKASIECRPYGFNSLSRAYAYFEELYYK